MLEKQAVKALIRFARNIPGVDLDVIKNQVKQEANDEIERLFTEEDEV